LDFAASFLRRSPRCVAELDFLPFAPSLLAGIGFHLSFRSCGFFVRTFGASVLSSARGSTPCSCWPTAVVRCGLPSVDVLVSGILRPPWFRTVCSSSILVRLALASGPLCPWCLLRRVVPLPVINWCARVDRCVDLLWLLYSRFHHRLTLDSIFEPRPLWRPVLPFVSFSVALGHPTVGLHRLVTVSLTASVFVLP